MQTLFYGGFAAWMVVLSGCTELAPPSERAISSDLASIAEDGVFDDAFDDTLSPQAACSCDRGWDYWGNPIPVGTTDCGHSVCGLDDKRYSCSSSGWVVQSTASCNGSSAPSNTKFGVNSATWYNSSCAQEAQVRSLGMGYYLEIALSENDKYTVASAVQCAINNGVIPIVRVCVTGNCGFQDVASYLRFLRYVDDNVSGIFYAIAGPNEPLSETWLPGLGGVSYPYSESEMNLLGQANAQYMNAVINGLNGRRLAQGGQIALLSPVYNCTHPDMSRFIGRMSTYGANFSALEGIAGNAYNVSTAQGLTIGHYVDNCQYAFASRGIAAPYDRFYVTEIGAYESVRNTDPNWGVVPHSTALANLSNQVNAMRTDRTIRAGLFFNGFGTNSDPNFDYGEISGSEWSQILGGAPPPPSCPCLSGVDNFCQYAPSTPNCPMTAPGGYCDPNGNGTFDDADWVTGYYDYLGSCN
ncbi:hypothetical protein [Haliangium ochraceum]|nr:hypothetical protein [Haliangium ochraceum]